MVGAIAPAEQERNSPSAPAPPTRHLRAWSEGAAALLTVWAGVAADKAVTAQSSGWATFFLAIGFAIATIIIVIGLLGLAEREQPGEIHGRKLARLVEDGGEYRLAPVTERGTYGVVEDATCVSPVRTTAIRLPIAQEDLLAQALSLHERSHAAPDERCGCGFHASDDDHPMLLPGEVVVDVVLSGRRIRTRNGFRAAHQQVLSVHIPRLCAIEEASGGRYGSMCGRFATGVVAMSNGAWPMCERHGANLSVSLDRVAASLGAEVDWLDWAALDPVEVDVR